MKSISDPKASCHEGLHMALGHALPEDAASGGPVWGPWSRGRRRRLQVGEVGDTEFVGGWGTECCCFTLLSLSN